MSSLNQMMKFATVCVALLIAAGCTQIKGAVEQGITAKRSYNDNKARVLLQGNCDIAVGSYWRVMNNLERRAVDTLCKGDIQLPATPAKRGESLAE